MSESVSSAIATMVAQQRSVDVFENWVQSKPEYRELLGKGPVGKLKRGSPELKSRSDCYQMAEELAGMYQRAGNTKSAAEICEDAAAIVFRKQMKSAARSEITSKLKARKGQATPKPTQTPDGVKGRKDDAIAYVNQWDAEHDPAPTEVAF